MQGRSPACLSRRVWSRPACTPESTKRRRHTENMLQSMGLGQLDKELYQRLAELRRDIAEEYNMPVFRVLQTETLRAMARVKPTTMEAASRLKGVGPWVRNHCLRAFVELIQDYEGV